MTASNDQRGGCSPTATLVATIEVSGTAGWQT
jgi:hypothetical protein